MNSTEIVLFTIIVFLFIIAIFTFLLLRKSFEKKKIEEQKKLEYKDIVNITPEFKFEEPGFKTPDIPSIDEIMKTVTTSAKESNKTIPREDEDLKTKDEELEEILIPEPKIIESLAENKEPQALTEDYSGLKLEDTLIDIEDEKKERKKPAAKKPEAKVTEKAHLKKRKKARKKKAVKEEPVEAEPKKAVKEEPIQVGTKKET
ncbi:MAG: hypothetical protein C3F06_00320 [Candidatus Methanoperedenaceae archaeon]|nr:MAG: hypothetical protein C3F06_00320 [Candidatus Methanoperedenaceae archaeon]